MTFRDSSDAKTKEVRYTYDVFDDLIRKEVDDNGNGTFDRDEAYVYDGDDVVLIFDDQGDWTHRYLHGEVVDQVFTEETVGEILWGLPDNQGTVRDIANYDPTLDSTAVDNHRKFEAFGNITAESDDTVDYRYAYTGRFYDADSELQYNRARWYDSTVGRWISEDPIGFAAGDSNINRYLGNSPTNGIDPSGLIGIANPHPPAPPAGYNHTPILLDSGGHAVTSSNQGWFDRGLNWAFGHNAHIMNAGSDPIATWAAQKFNEQTTIGQLAAGDLYGNQIWGDFGVSVAVHFDIPHTPYSGGFGIEAIYDWSNDGKPGTGWNFYGYGEGSWGMGIAADAPQPSTTTPSFSGAINVVSAYNFSPEKYQGTFYNTSAYLNSPLGGPTLGVSATDEAMTQFSTGQPVTAPYSFYGGWQWGPPSNIPAGGQVALQRYEWLNPRRRE